MSVDRKTKAIGVKTGAGAPDAKERHDVAVNAIDAWLNEIDQALTDNTAGRRNAEKKA